MSSFPRPNNPVVPEPTTRLKGRWLAGIRLAWLVIAGICLAVFIAAIPYGHAELRTVCTESSCRWYLMPAEERALYEMGLSLDFYAWYLTGVSSAVGLGFLLMAVLLIWLRSDDWMALFVSILFVAQGTEIAADYGIEALADTQLNWHWPVMHIALITSMSLRIGYLFPNGRFVPRWTSWLAFGWLILRNPAAFFPGSRFNFNNWPPILGLMIILVALGRCLFAPVFRYLRVSGPVERQQTKGNLP